MKNISLDTTFFRNIIPGDDIMKSSSKHLFVKKESPKYIESPFKIISFIYIYISGFQLIKNLCRISDFMGVSILKIKKKTTDDKIL